MNKIGKILGNLNISNACKEEKQIIINFLSIILDKILEIQELNQYTINEESYFLERLKKTFFTKMENQYLFETTKWMIFRSKMIKEEYTETISEELRNILRGLKEQAEQS